ARDDDGDATKGAVKGDQWVIPLCSGFSTHPIGFTQAVVPELLQVPYCEDGGHGRRITGIPDHDAGVVPVN
ncbi:hypothetical protein, partial [Klebsiella michiganensis]|uniref:hypothetical protein n=1 Tax=Klebsiella michiganensis TaxID=1134687 RepID=UPI0013D60BA1